VEHLQHSVKAIYMDNNKFEPDRKEGNPDQTYRDELAGKGSTFSDTPSEADARDKAKVEKALTGQSQKIDSIHPDELKDDDMDDMLRETLENK
jgi:hypothetical protein